MDTCGPTAYLRVSAIAIAIYDWLWTIPAAIRLYREQKSIMHLTRTCILFMLIRYTSILVVIISNIGFFDGSFTTESCHKFYLIAPALKAAQTMVSQAIVAVRTIAVSRQAPWVVWTVSTIFTISVALEFFANIWKRVPFQEPQNSFHANCTSGNTKGLKVVWVHYMAAMLYDAICLSIASGYIYVQSRGQPEHSIDGLSKMLLKEGLLYFGFLTAVNVFNLVLYIIYPEQAQSAGATLGYATTWIMSQRLIIHLQDYKNNARIGLPTISQTSKRSGKTGLPQFITGAETVDDVELGVRVTVEEAVKVDYDEDIMDPAKAGLPHRITTARIETEHRRREDRKKQRSRDGNADDEESFDARARRKAGGKGWEVTSAGKLFSP